MLLFNIVGDVSTDVKCCGLPPPFSPLAAVISSSFYSSGGLGKGEMSSTFLPLFF